jgi:hypothetical protein
MISSLWTLFGPHAIVSAPRGLGMGEPRRVTLKLQSTVLLVSAALFWFQAAGHSQTTMRLALLSATSQAGGFVEDLQMPEFEVLEGNRRCEIRHVTSIQRPLRVALLVDTSVSAARAVGSIREALAAFIDALDPLHEIVFITTGGTLLVRAGPTTDRRQLKAAAGRLFTDGGNVLVDAVDESYNRFLRSGDYNPVLMVMTMNGPGARTWSDKQSLARLGEAIRSNGGRVYGTILLLPTVTRPGDWEEVGVLPELDSVDICGTLAGATEGLCWGVPTPAMLASATEQLAFYINEIYRRSASSYVVEYAGAVKGAKPDIRVTRSGVRIQILSLH